MLSRAAFANASRMTARAGVGWARLGSRGKGPATATCRPFVEDRRRERSSLAGAGHGSLMGGMTGLQRSTLASKIQPSLLGHALRTQPPLFRQKQHLRSGPQSDPRKQQQEPPEGPQEGGSGKKGGMASRLTALAGLGSLLAAKSKYVLVALKLTKATPLVSMVLTSATYSLFFGVPYAVGMVGLMFVHECGHAMVMHQYGIKMSPMVFVPFMGAVIVMKSHPESVEHEAYIAFGGPVLGSAAAAAVAGIASATDSQLLYALADFGLMINLFNLLPIGDLDGGRIGKAISPLMAVGGLGIGGLMIYQGLVHNPLFYLIMLAGTWSTGSRLLGYDDNPQGYYNIPPRTKAGISVAYVALVAALMVAMAKNNQRRKTPKQLKAEREGVFLPESDVQHGDGLYDDFFADDTGSTDRF